MALAIPADLYKRISGRVDAANVVNTWNRGQQLIRGFTQPDNPETEDQIAIRAIFSVLTKRWGTILTGAQRSSWNAFAAANPVTNRLGNTVSRTGLSAYLELNSMQYIRTGAAIDNGPSLPRPSPITGLADTSSLVGANDLAIEGATHGYTTLTGLYVAVRATPTIPLPSITPNPSEYRLIQGVAASSTKALAASPGEYEYTATKYAYDDGDLVGIEFTIFNAEGWQSQPFRKVVTANSP